MQRLSLSRYILFLVFLLLTGCADDIPPSLDDIPPPLTKEELKHVLEETYDKLPLESSVPDWESLEPKKDPTVPVVQSTSFKSAPNGVEIANDFGILRRFNHLPNGEIIYRLLKGVVIIEIWMNPKLGSDTNNFLGIKLENESGGKRLVGKNDLNQWVYTENSIQQFFRPADGKGHDIRIVYRTDTASYDLFFDEDLIKANIAVVSAAENKRVVGITVNSGRGGRGTPSYFDDLRVSLESLANRSPKYTHSN